MAKKPLGIKKWLPYALGLAALALVIGALWRPQPAAGPGSDQGAGDGKAFSVLIDAGHGGFDVGATGVSGVSEQLLNLQVAQQLKQVLEDRGIECYMTRTDERALGQSKDEDMQNRAQMIYKSPATVMVSIHMNSFPQDSTVSGPQVFYQEGSREGAKLAEAIQRCLNGLGGSRRCSANDLMVLRSGNAPAVLVECGFITNPDEEAKLRDSGYQKRLVEAIADGLEAYCR